MLLYIGVLWLQLAAQCPVERVEHDAVVQNQGVPGGAQAADHCVAGECLTASQVGGPQPTRASVQGMDAKTAAAWSGVGLVLETLHALRGITLVHPTHCVTQRQIR